jgi:hypothetical protein
MRVAIIPADQDLPVRFEDIEPGLASYQKIVGGYIEAVRLVDGPLSVAMDYYCNEDFLAEQLPYNARATLLYFLSFEVQGYICGDVVCIGGVDRYGNDVGLSEKQAQHLRDLFNQREPITLERDS